MSQPVLEAENHRFTLTCSANGGWNHFTVTFEGTAEHIDHGVANYLARKPHLVVDVTDDQAEVLALLPLTMQALWPTCEHGLSLRLCAGPDHYPSREQEMAWEIN